MTRQLREGEVRLAYFGGYVGSSSCSLLVTALQMAWLTPALYELKTEYELEILTPLEGADAAAARAELGSLGAGHFPLGSFRMP